MSELSIKKAILFRAGIGWFVAEGTTEDDVLYFPIADKSLDDFLKTSFVSIQKGSATVKNMSFETKGLDYTLFNTDLAIEGMVRFLRGKSVEVVFLEYPNRAEDANPERIRKQATILGFQRQGTDVIIALFSEDKSVQYIKANDIVELKPKEEKILQQLQEFMTSLMTSNDKRKQSILRIQLSNHGKHVVRIKFLAEIPAWKLSYRLQLSEEDSILDTYGIVDNATLVDWTDAKLTLSTKTPVSFNFDLSSPHEIIRPIVHRERTMKIEPPTPVPASAMKYQSIMSNAVQEQAYDFDDGYGEFQDDEVQNEFPTSFDAQSSVKPGVSVEYEITNPVSIKQNESSMVPLSQSPIEGKKKHYFNPANHSLCPFFAIELKNTLGYALDKGPLTVVDAEGTFLGEAILPRVASDEIMLVTYALDQNVLIQVEERLKTTKLEINIQNGLQYQYYNDVKTRSYELNNRAEYELDLYLAISKKDGFKPQEKQDNDFIEVINEYRVLTKLNPKNFQTLKFSTENKYHRSTYLKQLSIKDLEKLLKNTDLSPEEQELVLAVLELAKAIKKLQDQKTLTEQKVMNLKERRGQIISTLEVLESSGSEDTIRKEYITEIQGIDKKLQKMIRELEDISKTILKNEEYQKNPKEYNLMQKKLKSAK